MAIGWGEIWGGFSDLGRFFDDSANTRSLIFFEWNFRTRAFRGNDLLFRVTGGEEKLSRQYSPHLFVIPNFGFQFWNAVIRVTILGVGGRKMGWKSTPSRNLTVVVLLISLWKGENLLTSLVHNFFIYDSFLKKEQNGTGSENTRLSVHQKKVAKFCQIFVFLSDLRQSSLRCEILEIVSHFRKYSPQGLISITVLGRVARNGLERPPC